MQDSSWIRAYGNKSIYTGGVIQTTRGSFGVADDANYNLKVSGNIYTSGSNAYFQYTNFYGAYLGSNWRKVVVGGDHSDIATSNGTIASDSWFRTYGDGGIYFNTHGGGWHMSDATWIRAYNSKSVYVAANLEIGGTSRFDGIVYFHGTNRGRATSYGSYATELHQIHGISFSSGSGDWDAYMNHGIASSDENGNDNDCMSINSYKNITCRLDSNDNDSASYFRITNNNTGASNVLAHFGYDGTRAVHYFEGKVGIATGADASYALKVNGHTYIANDLNALGGVKLSTSFGANLLGVLRADHNNSAADSLSLNSPHDITMHLDTGSSNTTSYFRIKANTTGSGASAFWVRDDGQVSCLGVTETSSMAYKKNITNIENPLEKIEKLRGIEFDYIDSNKHSIGMVAEEVAEIFPELVIKDDTGKVSAMSYTRMTAVLLEAVKELSKEVEDLRANNSNNNKRS